MPKFKCDTCQAVYWRPKSGPCLSPMCAGTLVKQPDPVKQQCEVCGKRFTVFAAGQRACPGVCTTKLRKREDRLRTRGDERRAMAYELRKAELRDAPADLRTPLMPMRKCHDCGAETWDYRCAKCRGQHMRKHGVLGRYELPEAAVSSIDSCPFL